MDNYIAVIIGALVGSMLAFYFFNYLISKLIKKAFKRNLDALDNVYTSFLASSTTTLIYYMLEKKFSPWYIISAVIYVIYRFLKKDKYLTREEHLEAKMKRKVNILAFFTLSNSIVFYGIGALIYIWTIYTVYLNWGLMWSIVSFFTPVLSQIALIFIFWFGSGQFFNFYSEVVIVYAILYWIFLGILVPYLDNKYSTIAD